MKAPTMNGSFALFLQGIVVLVGLVTLGLMLWEPHLEGRNVNATTFEIYFKDPFLAYVYVGSIPYFLALRRAFRLLGEVRQRGAFSPATVRDLRAIKRCGLATVGFVAGAVIIILIFSHGEDGPGGVFMCLLAALVAGSIAGTAALFARSLQSALNRASALPA